MARVFVTGGSGLLGTALITALLERGDQVVALARSPASADKLVARGVAVRRGEIEDESQLAEAMVDCELAFNLAGINKFCVSDPAEMMRANVDGALVAGAGREARRGAATRAHLVGGDDR